MFGGYGQGRQEMPRVIHISIARYRLDLPAIGEPLDFIVSIHEEGTGITWQQNVTVNTETEKFLVDATYELFLWSENKGLTFKKANNQVQEIGDCLYKTFIGDEGTKVLERIRPRPTAILFNVDETILNLPWELIGISSGQLSIENIPFGRLVTTRTILREGRDPLQEDKIVRILVVVNPTLDISDKEGKDITALHKLQENIGRFQVEVELLAREQATLNNFRAKLAAGDYDMLHFSGHGFLNRNTPGMSALRFADGELSADDVLKLPWKKPPYFVFSSACESSRAKENQRLVSGDNQTNGLAAAFLAAGVSAYAGYFWPVTDTGSGIFTETFYNALFELENVGLAFMEARRMAMMDFDEIGDLTGVSAVLFGDAASAHRQDLVMKK